MKPAGSTTATMTVRLKCLCEIPLCGHDSCWVSRFGEVLFKIGVVFSSHAFTASRKSVHRTRGSHRHVFRACVIDKFSLLAFNDMILMYYVRLTPYFESGFGIQSWGIRGYHVMMNHDLTFSSFFLKSSPWFRTKELPLHLLARDQSVSYTHLTLPTIYSV